MTASYVEGHALLGDTIVAQSTPAGRSAIAVIRISGPRAHEIARRHLSPFPERARIAELATFRDTEGSTVDHPVVTRFDAPASYTGEDVVELSTHGGLAAPALVIEQLVGSGARPAEPGEFTRRAVLNGKLDLIQAEAVGDLIDARSRALHRAAVNQLDRGLSRRIEGLREALLDVEAMLAYDIDFPEEDEGPIARERITEAGAAVLERIEALLATAPAGELLREGAVVVIAGQPNVGKSSLFNALIGRARAIVTDVPGTTRDALEAVIEGSRWPIRLIDTAGLRDTQELVERLGVEVSERHVAAADVVLACGDSVDAVRAAVERCQQLARGAAVLPVRTKIDLVAKRDFFRHDAGTATDGDSAAVSAETGEGLRDLLARVESLIDTRVGGQPSDAPTITRERHRAALETARDEVRAFAAAWEEDALPATVAAVHLRAAAGVLEELIGTLDVEDVLDVVFRSFCVGK